MYGINIVELLFTSSLWITICYVMFFGSALNDCILFKYFSIGSVWLFFNLMREKLGHREFPIAEIKAIASLTDSGDKAKPIKLRLVA